jgi:Ca-activated chloride channel family protein
MEMLTLLATLSWGSLWLTPDQQAARHFERGEYAAAAALFTDTQWQGAAWYRAGEFERAAEAFARGDDAQAHFNQGNARLMRGDYAGAIGCYDAALARRPQWAAAEDNRALAAARAARVAQEGGDLGDQRVGADEIVFDNGQRPGGEDTEVAGGGPLTDEQVQALWLRRVQTRPADFLRAKFAWQQATRSAESAP